MKARFQRFNVNLVVAMVGVAMAMAGFAMPDDTSWLVLSCSGTALFVAAFLAEAFA